MTFFSYRLRTNSGDILMHFVIHHIQMIFSILIDGHVCEILHFQISRLFNSPFLYHSEVHEVDTLFVHGKMQRRLAAATQTIPSELVLSK